MKKLVLVIGLIAVAAAAAVPVDAAEGEFGGTTTPVDVVVQGRGFGHGRGMGQFGALGYAVDHSWTYDRILDHFYSNTMSVNPVANEPFYVHLTAENGLALIVQSDSDFTVGEVQVAANHAARVDLENDGTFRIDTAESCGGPWTVAAVGVAGDSDRGGRHYVQATPATTTGQTLTDMLRLCTVFGERAYRGSLRLVDIGGDKFTLNEVLIEDYLLGVVPRESPAFWGTITAGEGGDEALKARPWRRARTPWRAALPVRRAACPQTHATQVFARCTGARG